MGPRTKSKGIGLMVGGGNGGCNGGGKMETTIFIIKMKKEKMGYKI